MRFLTLAAMATFGSVVMAQNAFDQIPQCAVGVQH
jgi:hypothetical protein